MRWVLLMHLHSCVIIRICLLLTLPIPHLDEQIFITVVCGRTLQISALISSWHTNSSKCLQENKAFLMQHQWVAESFGQKRERRMTNNRHTLSIASNSTKAQASSTSTSTGNSTNTGNGNAAVVSEGSSDPKRSNNGKTKAARELTKRELRGLLAYELGIHACKWWNNWDTNIWKVV